MAPVTLFRFRPAETLLHRMDPRKKLFLMAAGSIAALGSSPLGTAPILLLIAAGFVCARIPPSDLFRAGGIVWVFLAVLFAAHALQVEPFWPEGAATGALAALRLFLIVAGGHLLAATSSATSLVAAVAWYLRPIPRIRHQRVALLASLSLAFIPLVLDQAAQARDALVSRCGDRDGNRIRRIVRTARPVLVRTLLRSGAISSALEARCYGDERTPPRFSSASGELPIFLAALLLLLLSVVLPVQLPGLLSG